MQRHRFKILISGFYADFEKAIEKHKKGQRNDIVGKPNPTTLLNAYCNNREVKKFVDNIVLLCTRPTFIPALKKHISGNTPSGRGPLDICPEAFILSHAVQILLFAPQDWDPKRVYSRNQGKYPHRFPSPSTVGGGTGSKIDNRFSMEDLHRAILLFYYLVARRNGNGAWIECTPTTQFNHEVPDPKVDSILSISTLLVKATTTTSPTRTISIRFRPVGETLMPPLSAIEFKRELGFLKERHDHPNFDSTFASLQPGRSDIKSFILEQIRDSTNSLVDQVFHAIVIEEFNFYWYGPISVHNMPMVWELSTKLDKQGYLTPEEHRKANLVSFDWRNFKLLDSKMPQFFGSRLQNPQNKDVASIEAAFYRAYADENCGLALFHNQTQVEPPGR
ncbi:hypothetical protein F53441_2712 [Fusarium austroafricanum]|uniref:Uncharacterized protein n=1 Tax=Fusarium austroafricanum TaxID=2364996 RepID=A0A8H4KR75_9HYPO|nr:hypothetical protein F53441_2712 [Fusarium austroafricanum]